MVNLQTEKCVLSEKAYLSYSDLINEIYDIIKDYFKDYIEDGSVIIEENEKFEYTDIQKNIHFITKSLIITFGKKGKAIIVYPRPALLCELNMCIKVENKNNRYSKFSIVLQRDHLFDSNYPINKVNEDTFNLYIRKVPNIILLNKKDFLELVVDLFRYEVR